MKRTEKIKKNVKGITLIALVVTIIVLLILAGIAINLTVGNNGLFSRAQNAANTWRKAEVNEQAEMKNFEDLYDNTVKQLGLENSESDEITFYIDDDKWTVKNGTTWNDFFSENFPNDYTSWFYITETEVICKYIDDTSDVLYVKNLEDEKSEIQKISHKIKPVKYKTSDERSENVGTPCSTFSK